MYILMYSFHDDSGNRGRPPVIARGNLCTTALHVDLDGYYLVR